MQPPQQDNGKDPARRIPQVNVQWHITTACSNRCRHCCMYGPATYGLEKSRTLSAQGMPRTRRSATRASIRVGRAG